MANENDNEITNDNDNENDNDNHELEDLFESDNDSNLFTDEKTNTDTEGNLFTDDGFSESFSELDTHSEVEGGGLFTDDDDESEDSLSNEDNIAEDNIEGGEEVKENLECVKGNGTCINNSNIKNLIMEFAKSKNISAKSFDETIDELLKLYEIGYESCLLKNKEFLDFAATKNVQQDFINKYIDDNFLPIGPRDGERDNYPWLSNTDIDTVLSKLSKEYDNVHHIPFQMIDFEQTKTQLANTDFVDLVKKSPDGVKMIVVINTDKSDGRGIHWFAVYMDLSANGGTIEHYNSSGKGPKTDLLKFLCKTKKSLEEAFPSKKFEIKINHRQHQKKNTECGVYSCFYLWARLSGIPCETLFTKDIKDNRMEDFRSRMFRKC